MLPKRSEGPEGKQGNCPHDVAEAAYLLISIYKLIPWVKKKAAGLKCLTRLEENYESRNFSSWY